MLNERRKAANEVAAKLFELETAIDQAMICAAELAAAMPRARMDARLSAVIGQEAVSLVSDSLTSLCAARGKAVDAHNVLADVHQQIGLRTYATGGLYKLLGSETGLSLVSREAA